MKTGCEESYFIWNCWWYNKGLKKFLNPSPNYLNLDMKYKVIKIGILHLKLYEGDGLNWNSRYSIQIIHHRQKLQQCHPQRGAGFHPHPPDRCRPVVLAHLDHCQLPPRFHCYYSRPLSHSHPHPHPHPHSPDLRLLGLEPSTQLQPRKTK